MADTDEQWIAEQLRQRLEELHGQDLTDAEVEAEVRNLLAIGKPAIPVLLELFSREDETLLAVASQTFKAWGTPRPVDALLNLLRDPGVSDLAKALILNVLEQYGLDVNDPQLLGLGIDLEELGLESGEDGGNGTPES